MRQLCSHCLRRCTAPCLARYLPLFATRSLVHLSSVDRSNCHSLPKCGKAKLANLSAPVSIDPGLWLLALSACQPAVDLASICNYCAVSILISRPGKWLHFDTRTQLDLDKQIIVYESLRVGNALPLVRSLNSEKARIAFYQCR